MAVVSYRLLAHVFRLQLIGKQKIIYISWISCHICITHHIVLILIYCVSSVVILSFSFSFFHSSFIQCYPLGSSYLVGKVLSIGI